MLKNDLQPHRRWYILGTMLASQVEFTGKGWYNNKRPGSGRLMVVHEAALPGDHAISEL